MSRLFAILMAGGSGTRFWPASRRSRPKQLLPLGGDLPLLAATSRRLSPIVPGSRQVVITNLEYVDAVREMLPEVPPEQVVGEPEGRDTAPAIGLAARLVERLDADAICVAMPSDHVIRPEGLFREHLLAAELALEAHPASVLVFGIEPDHPATGYGYLRRGAAVGEYAGRAVHRLEAFVEKPDRATAESLLRQGDHSWNAGLFAFRPAALAAAYERLLPEMASALAGLAEAWGRDDFEARMAAVFPTLRRISIDYGVMEHLDDALVLPLPVEWDDVGSWTALRRLLEADERGNVVEGEALLLGSSGCVVSARGGLVALRGVDDLIVVHTPDATLVCRRDDDQGVKDLVEALRAKGLLSYL
ncbi:MAG: mannose-1-phosphate guanylyltransferase [Planctomycetes bacterium]|nr:mannose-1-phosphate guanylyltransferase [Planctomycetota bacterium]